MQFTLFEITLNWFMYHVYLGFSHSYNDRRHREEQQRYTAIFLEKMQVYQF